MSASVKLEIYIKDACILIDMIEMGILSDFYQLPLSVFTTQYVLYEITDEAQLAEVNAFVQTGQLHIDIIGQFEKIASIVDTNPGLSFTDASVLEAALRRNANILSSDKGLRNESKRRDVRVHGILWILEELYNHQIIEQTTLFEKLELYPIINQWAPRAEIEKILTKYKS